ncbi:MAG: hypothetical protein ACR2LZ_08490 [Pyrinomonadaceae bacterium]
MRTRRASRGSTAATRMAEAGAKILLGEASGPDTAPEIRVPAIY